MASILSSYNFVVTVTLGRNEKYDLLAVNPRGKTLKISVKTLYNGNMFPLLKKNEDLFAKNIFYSFVNLKGLKNSPKYWIVPSKFVAKTVKESHKKWLKRPNKQGGEHNDNERRAFYCRKNKHEQKGYFKKIQCFESNVKPLLNF